jgi:predicted MFS family arabinose efflux permease
VILIAGILKALGQGAGTPSIQAHCVKALGPEKAGVASSTCFIGQDIGNTIAPIFGGLVVTSFGYSTLFYGYAAVLAVVGCSLFALQRYLEKRKQTAL